MAGGVITAAIWGAIIQAIPLTIAAGAGLIGLQNWREQLKTRRQVEVAEACLLSGENAIGAARATRTRHFAVAEDETRNRQAISAAIQKSTGHRFDEAWRAYRDFAGKYRLADLYLALGEPNLAQELASCLRELNGAAEVAFYYDKSEDHPSSQSVEAKAKFYGPIAGEEPDAISKRLQKILDGLNGKLTPLLRNLKP